MREFPSYFSYSDFASYVMRQNRHFPKDEHQDFLEALWETSPSRTKRLPANFRLCRAQEGCRGVDQFEDDEIVDQRPAPFEVDRMRPLRDRAKEGRANPKGIPCLYLASETTTAIAEVRPWIGAQVSVGTFEIQRDLRIVDFSESDHEWQFCVSGIYSAAAREEKAWADVNGAFRRPVTQNDDESSYAPTQIIADMFKARGLDGVAYKSAVGKGINFALFDLDCARMVQAAYFQ